MKLNWALVVVQLALIFYTAKQNGMLDEAKLPSSKAQAQSQTKQELQLELLQEEEIDENTVRRIPPKPKPRPPEPKKIRSPDIYVPPELVDGKITVQLRDGTKYRFESNEFAVVRRVTKEQAAKRKAKPKPKPKPKPKVVTKVVERVVEKVVEKETFKRHTIKFLAGAAYCDLQLTESDEDKVILAQRQKPTFGIGYDYKFSKRWSVGAQAFSDESAYASVGYSF